MFNEEIHLKLKQFSEFFSIPHNFNINAQTLTNGESTSHTDFVNAMPASFKLANDIDALDQQALAPLGALTGVASQLVNYLNQQTQKIDLLINHMLSEQDNEKNRYQGIAFGGGGIEFKTDTPFNLNDVLEVKIFLTDQNCAIYCHAEVIEVINLTEMNDKDYGFSHKVIFNHIRENDRERLVRSSLHIQSRQLQQLAKERNTQSNL